MAKQLETSPTAPISQFEILAKCEAFTKSLQNGIMDRLQAMRGDQMDSSSDGAWRVALAETFVDLFLGSEAGSPEALASALAKRVDFSAVYNINLRYFDLPPFPASRSS